MSGTMTLRITYDNSNEDNHDTVIYDDNDDIVGGASFGAARGWRSFFS
jgi:hypothetical protein